MSSLVTLKLLAMLAMLGSAAVTDVRERRIPNGVILFGAGTAVALSALEAGGLPASSLLGLVVALAITFPVFALGALGAGDAKLLAAVGAFMGVGGLLPVLLYTGIAGGILGLASAIRRGVILPILIEAKNLGLYLLTLGRHGARRTFEDPNAVTIPYGVAIAAGAAAAWFFPISLGGVS